MLISSMRRVAHNDRETEGYRAVELKGAKLNIKSEN